MAPNAATSSPLLGDGGTNLTDQDYPNLGPAQTITSTTTTFLQNGSTVPAGFAVAAPMAAAGRAPGC